MSHPRLGAQRRRTLTGVGLLLAGVVLLGAGSTGATILQAPVQLGSAASFAVLAGAGVTDTGPSVIRGDVGTDPVAAIPDLLDREATGTVHRADDKAGEAQRDVAAAVTTMAGLPLSGAVSLGEVSSVGPGVHLVSDGSGGLGGGLTLDGRGMTSPAWIFVVPGDMVTAPGAAIRLLNGAEACNVFWLVGGSATLGSASGFAGTIVAKSSITVGRRVTIEGRLLAAAGRVALTGDTITVPTCSARADGALLAAATGPPPQRVTDQASTSRGAAAPGRGVLPPFLPAVMVVLLVASVLLGEPRGRRHRRRDRYRL